MITNLGVAEAGDVVRNINPDPLPHGRCHHHGRVPKMTVNWTLVTPGPSLKNELGLFSTRFSSFYLTRWFV